MPTYPLERMLRASLMLPRTTVRTANALISNALRLYDPYDMTVGKLFNRLNKLGNAGVSRTDDFVSHTGDRCTVGFPSVPSPSSQGSTWSTLLQCLYTRVSQHVADIDLPLNFHPVATRAQRVLRRVALVEQHTIGEAGRGCVADRMLR